ncbi:MAG: tRNA lysidine(34) synthetase TilS [Anaerolineae bacterium]|nr:tRNA lysidine(34) synthetase TilS [Anaerolineae bacterium]
MSVLHKTVLMFLKTAVSPINLLSQSVKLVVGVSGGPDSLALLHVLTQVVGPTRLVVAHLNHGYRETAVAEADFVQIVAREWGVVCETKTIDLTRLIQESGNSLEEAGRKARYAFFCDVAHQYETPYLVVGHHGDDQAETVLMNLLRGTGLRGLRGMLPVTAMQSGDRDYSVLRPFLSVSRQDIDEYCREFDLTPVFDESNEDISFFRNRIRQELLPLLTDYNANIRAHLCQLAALTAADVALLESLTAETWSRVVLDVDDEAIVIDRAAWNVLPLGLRRGILRQALVEKRPFLKDVTFQAIEQARLVAERPETGQRFNLPGEMFLIVDYDRLIITEDKQIVLDDWPQFHKAEPERLAVPGVVALSNGWKIEAALVDAVDLIAVQAAADKWRAYVDISAGQDLFVRTREPGERFQPLGMNGRSTKVKEFMIDRKIGARWREAWPLVASGSQLVWIAGHGMDERMKITEETSSIVQLQCYKG